MISEHILRDIESRFLNRGNPCEKFSVECLHCNIDLLVKEVRARQQPKTPSRLSDSHIAYLKDSSLDSLKSQVRNVCHDNAAEWIYVLCRKIEEVERVKNIENLAEALSHPRSVYKLEQWQKDMEAAIESLKPKMSDLPTDPEGTKAVRIVYRGGFQDGQRATLHFKPGQVHEVTAMVTASGGTSFQSFYKYCGKKTEDGVEIFVPVGNTSAGLPGRKDRVLAAVDWILNDAYQRSPLQMGSLLETYVSKLRGVWGKRS